MFVDGPAISVGEDGSLAVTIIPGERKLPRITGANEPRIARIARITLKSEIRSSKSETNPNTKKENPSHYVRLLSSFLVRAY